MVKKHIIIYLSFLFGFSSCFSRRDSIHIVGNQMHINLHKNSTLFRANKLLNDSINSIILSSYREDKIDFNLLDTKKTGNITSLHYSGKSIKQLSMVLAKFPNIKYLDTYFSKKGSKIIADSVFEKLVKLETAFLYADTVKIYNLPASLRNLSITSKYVHFPYLPNHMYDELGFLAENEGFDYRNLRNINNKGFVGISLPKKIILDSIYCNLKADSLKFMSLYCENIAYTKTCTKIPHIKLLEFYSNAFEKNNCTKCLDADTVTVVTTEANAKTYNKENYYNYFIKRPLLGVNIYESIRSIVPSSWSKKGNRQ